MCSPACQCAVLLANVHWTIPIGETLLLLVYPLPGTVGTEPMDKLGCLIFIYAFTHARHIACLYVPLLALPQLSWIVDWGLLRPHTLFL